MIGRCGIGRDLAREILYQNAYGRIEFCSGAKTQAAGGQFPEACSELFLTIKDGRSVSVVGDHSQS